MVMTIDMKAYKQRFRELKQETSYQRVNRVGDASKAKAWATCEPLNNEQLWDDFSAVEYTTVLTSIDPHHASRRSTKAGALYGQVYAEMRVTERLAILHSLGAFRFMSDDPVIRLNELPELRFCIACKRKKPILEFVYRPKFLHTWSYECVSCKTKQVNKVWRKYAA